MTHAKFITISLSPEKDADILEFFAPSNCHDRSYRVRQILRDYITQQPQTTDETKGGKDEA